MNLWEADHPYYMTEGNYLSNGCHTEWESLELFLAEFGDADVDYNLVVRWDWREGDGWGLPDYSGSDTDRVFDLMVQIVHQRKAHLTSHRIKVCRNDESAARNFLEKHATRIAQNWAPITLSR
jgi:hypothetical protein